MIGRLIYGLLCLRHPDNADVVWATPRLLLMKVLTTATRRSREDLVHQIIDGGGTALALFVLATSLLNVGDHALAALIGEAVAHDVNEGLLVLNGELVDDIQDLGEG